MAGGAIPPTAMGTGEPGTLSIAAAAAAMAPSWEAVPVAHMRAPNRPRRLGPVKEFVAAGGDWGPYQDGSRPHTRQ
ncbi:unnamed protein product [Lampetra planeri]